MQERFSRTELIFGQQAMQKLFEAHVAVFGVGGVGGYALEVLARSGVGALTIVDHDTVSVSNINRQILATEETVGLPKAEAAARRVALINPNCRVTVKPLFYLPETREEFDFTQYTYVVDAIDTVTAKLDLAVACQQAGVPLISCMGTGNKTDPMAFRVADINQTRVCPLARIIRKECKKRGVNHLQVVYSEEPALTPDELSDEQPPEGRRSIPGSNAFVPAAAGLLLGSQVVKAIAGVAPPKRVV